MNICQPGSPVAYLTGGEVWFDDDFPEVIPTVFNATVDSLFMIYSPMYFDDNGDYEPPAEPVVYGTHDCVFTITPANANEKIFLSVFNMRVNGQNGEIFTDLTTDMNCGNNYISINGVKKCGNKNIPSEQELANFIGVEFGAGESVEFELKTDNTDSYFSFQIFTGVELPAGLSE